MKKYYQFAGVDLMIEIPDHKMYTDARDLAPFEVEPTAGAALSNRSRFHTFRYEMVEELTPPSGTCIALEPGFRVYDEGEWSARYIGSVQDSWEPAYMRAAHRGREHVVQLKASQYAGEVGTHTVLGSIAAEHLVAGANGVIFHSSYIDWQGKGILFTAPSGTGKSTQAELWRSLRGAEIINGDRSAIRVVDGMVFAEGVPFSGSSQICVNRTLPLAAIVYLAQAPETTIRQLRGYEAFFRIWEGCSVNTWDEEDMRLVSETVQKVSATVPVFYLACTPDESAVIALEQALEWE
ncbi:MAG: hypothetical protein IJZ85_02545 [Lachnospiraceae bacterium]|nr:hypothetical protein [Lachnospiraceae bacterium]